MDLSIIARTINYYPVNLIKPDKVEALLMGYLFELQMSGYYKDSFLIYNYQKQGCYLTYYEGVDSDDKQQTQLGCKSKFTTLTYPTGDKKDFLYQVEIINILSQNFHGYVYDPKNKKVISASEAKFLY